MIRKVLVTGAAGFIGSHTVEHFLSAGHTVLGVDNFRTGHRENLAAALSHRQFTFQELDVADEQAFFGLVRTNRPDVIVHLAALVSVPESIANPALNTRLNLHATRVMADAAGRFRIARIVFASSAAVYGDPPTSPIGEDAPTAPLSPYGAAKLASEHLLLEAALEQGFVARCQRYFNVYGPRQDPRSPYSGVISIFKDRAAGGRRPTIFGDGEQTRDFVSVFDVARANVIAATHAGLTSGAVNICTGRPVSLNALWSQLAGRAATALRPDYAPARPGDIRHSCGSPNAAREVLGFEARIQLADGLRF
jgi:UDP-glucose 4-epimerase